jgi:hypothetical protein
MHFAVSRYNPIFGKNFRPTLAPMMWDAGRYVYMNW